MPNTSKRFIKEQDESEDENSNESEASYISEEDVDDIDDIDVDDDEEEENNSKDSKKKKKKPTKIVKLPINEALKTVSERSLYTEVDRFFTKKCTPDMIQKMVKIINKDGHISLRLLNWFATKHSATMAALVGEDQDGNVNLFDVKISYRAGLSTHTKEYFDPFRRGKKFDYNYDKRDKDKVVETTLCQLNFFKWMFTHSLLKYVEDNLDDLKNKMGTFNTAEKKKKDAKKLKKEKLKKLPQKSKKEDIKLKVKRFTEDTTSKVVIII
jgi:hypothetical protein